MAPDHKRWNQQSYLLVPFFMVNKTGGIGNVWNLEGITRWKSDG